MRRTILVALVMTPLTALVVSACVGDDPAASDDSAAVDGSANDTSVTGDVTTGDGSTPITDAGIDAAPCTGTWCTCGTAKTAVFCDDFDKPAEKLAQNWTYDASFVSTDAGVVKLVTTQFESKPRSMNAMVAADTMRDISAALTEDLGGKSSTIAFDLHLDTSLSNCNGETVDFAQVGIGNSITPGPNAYVRFSAAKGVPILTLSNGIPIQLEGDASLPSTWVRIRMTAQLGPFDGGGNGVTTSVYVTPAGSDDALDASALLSGSVKITTGTTASWLSIGALNSESTEACTVFIDNVAIYQ